MRIKGIAPLALTALAAFSARADTISGPVGRAINESEGLEASGDYKGAMSKMDEADRTPGKTATDQKYINMMRDHIRVTSADYENFPSPLSAQAKFAKNYNAKSWDQVIKDIDYLRKESLYDTKAQTVIGQVYYFKHDCQQAVQVWQAGIEYGRARGQDVLGATRGIELCKTGKVANVPVSDVPDEFYRNPSAAMAKFSDWQRASFTFAAINFADRHFMAGYSAVPNSVQQHVNQQVNSLNHNFTWDQWFQMTQGANQFNTQFNVTCNFAPSNVSGMATVRQGETRQGSMKLNAAQGSNLVFDCRP